MGPDNFRYFLRDPLSDLRDLCVNLWSFSSVPTVTSVRDSSVTVGAGADPLNVEPHATQGEAIDSGFGKSRIYQQGRKRLAPKFYSSPESCDNHD